MRPRLLLAAAVLGLTIVAVGCGGTSDGSSGAASARTVDIDMHGTAYSPDHVTVHDGETIRFVFRNRDTSAHDAFVGDEQAQMDHESTMGTMGGMGHGDTDAITVDPGQTATLNHTFHAGENVLIGCHETGHYAAGMKLTITVQ